MLLLQAVVVSGPIWAERRGPGLRILLRDLSVDLGYRMAVSHGRFKGLSVSDTGTTIVTIPRGFDTDFSSFPPLPLPIALLMGDVDMYDVAGVVHDYLYRIGVDRGVADLAWRVVARSGDGVGSTRGLLGWVGLRVGGWRAYNRRKRQRDQAGVAA